MQIVKNFLIGALGVGVLVLGGMLYISQKSKNVQVIVPSNDTVPVEGTDIVGSVMTPPGTVTGKLCFPSEMLPAGAIEAKSTDNTEVAQVYAGSAGGASNLYSMDLPAGTYIFRYKADVSPTTSSYGYHTTTCPTGLETTCAQSYAREHIQVSVVSGQTVTGVDLCDFYYDSQNPPAF